MKKRSVLFVFIIAAFVSVTSGCYVGYGYGHPYRDRHYRQYDRYEDNHDDHDNGYRGSHRGDK